MNATNIEYEEAPSGNVTFYNYKEPLMKFKGVNDDEGYGFVGALIFDTASGKIQCHLCGQWFDRLENHINKEHAVNANEYKRIVGLTKKTALINEKIRAKMIEHGRTNKKNLLNLRAGGKKSKREREQIRATLKENRDEMKNLRGTCPEQLISRLLKLHDEKGYTPRTKEIPFYDALIATYGSYPEACRVAGIPERKVGQNVEGTYGTKTKYHRTHVVKALNDYYEQNQSFSGISRNLPKGIYDAFSRLTKRNPKEKDAILRDALGFDGRYRKVDRVFHYSKEELLEFIIRFREINGRVPGTSDCKRGLLPYASRYLYYFGSWRKTLEAAFPGESYPEQIATKGERIHVPVSANWTLRQKFKKNQKRIMEKRAMLVNVT